LIRIREKANAKPKHYVRATVDPGDQEQLVDTTYGDSLKKRDVVTSAAANGLDREIDAASHIVGMDLKSVKGLHLTEEVDLGRYRVFPGTASKVLAGNASNTLDDEIKRLKETIATTLRVDVMRLETNSVADLCAQQGVLFDRVAREAKLLKLLLAVKTPAEKTGVDLAASNETSVTGFVKVELVPGVGGTGLRVISKGRITGSSLKEALGVDQKCRLSLHSQYGIEPIADTEWIAIHGGETFYWTSPVCCTLNNHEQIVPKGRFRGDDLKQLLQVGRGHRLTMNGPTREILNSEWIDIDGGESFFSTLSPGVCKAESPVTQPVDPTPPEAA
jgi:hypothetical protein